MKTRSQRGSSLIVSMLVITILTVIGVAMVRFAAREQAGALATTRQAALVACARAAAHVLQSQFGLGVAPTDPLDLPIGDQTERDSVRILGGHIDQDSTSVSNLKDIQVVGLRLSSASGSQQRVMDITNRVVGLGAGGGVRKVLAHCQIGDKSGPTTGRQIEVELAIQNNL